MSQKCRDCGARVHRVFLPEGSILVTTNGDWRCRVRSWDKKSFRYKWWRVFAGHRTSGVNVGGRKRGLDHRSLKGAGNE